MGAEEVNAFLTSLEGVERVRDLYDSDVRDGTAGGLASRRVEQEVSDGRT